MFTPSMNNFQINPGMSSQTTTQKIIFSGDTQITIGGVYNASGVIILISKERTWDDVMEMVIHERAKTWEELAAL